MKTQLFDIDNWREILTTLSRNRTRTFLTAFGIFWGTAILAMLHGGATGLSGLMMRELQGIETNMGGIAPMPTSMSYNGFNKGMMWTLTITDMKRAQRMCPDMEYMSPIISKGGSVSYADRSKSGQILGVGGQHFYIQRPVVEAGRLINEADVANRAKNVVLGKELANDLFGADPEEALGRYVSINGLYYKVIGVARQVGEASIVGRLDQQAILPVSTLAAAYGNGDDIDWALFTARDGANVKDLFPIIRRAIRQSHPLHPNDDKAIEEFDVSEMFQNISKVFMGVNLLGIFVGLGTLLAGVIGVGNIMWIIVRERTGEIGIRRAIGATPRNIITQILSESVVLTAVAGTAGIIFAVLVLFVADKATADPALGSAGFQLSFVSGIVILVTFAVLGGAAGLIPAIKAMRIKPVEAMRSK